MKNPMKSLMKIASPLVMLMGAAQFYGQTTTVTATVTDSQGTAWASAPYSIIWAGQGNPSTTAGQSFTLKYTGTTNSSGALSVAGVTDVKYIAPSGSLWNVCVTSATSSPATYCITASITGTTMSLSTPLSAAVVPPSITGGAQTWAYADTEVSAFAGNQYYRTSDGTFRCYTSSWGACLGAGGVIGSTTQIPFNNAGVMASDANLTWNTLANGGLAIGPPFNVTDYPGTVFSVNAPSSSGGYTQAVCLNPTTSGQCAWVLQANDGTNWNHYFNIFQNNSTGPNISDVYFANAHASGLYGTDAEMDIGSGLVIGTGGVINNYIDQYSTPTMVLNDTAGMTVPDLVVTQLAAPGAAPTGSPSTVLSISITNCLSRNGVAILSTSNTTGLSAGMSMTFNSGFTTCTELNGTTATLLYVTNNTSFKVLDSTAHASTAETATAATTMAAATYYAKVIPIDAGGQPSGLSAESSGVVVAANGYITWTMPAVPASGIHHYELHVATTSGSETTSCQNVYNVAGGGTYLQTNTTYATCSSITGVVNKTGLTSSPTYGTTTNCTSSAAPAVCASAAAGSVVVAAAATTVVVNTTAVTANSQIIVQEDSSLGTKLSVTCNVTPAVAPPTVSARVAATSFTITTTVPTTNPRCFSYTIVN
jgi:hypothetical protein